MAHANGEIIWVRDSGKVQIKEGDTILLYGVVSDITERKQIEEEIRQRAEQQAIVAELGQQALSSAQLDELLELTVGLVANTLNIEYCEILKYLPNDEELLLRAASGWDKQLVKEARFAAYCDTQAGYTLSVNQAVTVEDLYGFLACLQRSQSDHPQA